MANLKVLSGGNTPNTTPGSEKWAKDVREEARELAGNLDEGYMELAKLLYRIYDTPIDGDPKNAPIYTKWGYTTYGDYVWEELGIHPKKAQRLRRVWYTLEIKLGDKLDPELKKRIVSLGMSKAKTISSVLTSSNAEKWTEKAEELSVPKLETLVRKYKDELDNRIKEQGELPPSEGGFEGGGEGGDGLPPAVDTVIGAPLDDVPVPDYEPDSMKMETFSLHADQHDIVVQALATAQKLSNSTVKSNNLHLICLDFLATNGDGKTTKQQKLRRLTQIAGSYGLKLVVVDEDEVVFGLETLEQLAKGE